MLSDNLRLIQSVRFSKIRERILMKFCIHIRLLKTEMTERIRTSTRNTRRI